MIVINSIYINHMNKFTLIRQFEIFLEGINKELKYNNIDSYERKKFFIDSNVVLMR